MLCEYVYGVCLGLEFIFSVIAARENHKLVVVIGEGECFKLINIFSWQRWQWNDFWGPTLNTFHFKCRLTLPDAVDCIKADLDSTCLLKIELLAFYHAVKLPTFIIIEYKNSILPLIPNIVSENDRHWQFNSLLAAGDSKIIHEKVQFLENYHLHGRVER